MALIFKNAYGSPSMVKMQLFIVHLLGFLAFLSKVVLAQFAVSEAVTGSASFPAMATTCIGNLAVFFTCLIRGRLDVEMGARDLLTTIRGPKLQDLNGFGLTTYRVNLYEAYVVILSNHTPNSSMRQFMRYIHIAYRVNSIVLHCLTLQSAEVSAEIRNCNCNCNCIVFGTVEEIRMMLAERMPGTLKQLSDSHCLLPCLTCFRNGCHRCNQGLLHVEEHPISGIRKLIEGSPKGWPVAAVCEMLDRYPGFIVEEEQSCICIPTRASEDDEWTKMLIRCLKSKDKEGRGVINLTSDALQNYMAQSGVCDEKEEYSTVSLIVPRLTEVLINIILTAWFKVDGFSSSLVARRAIRDYIVDSRGSGFAAHVFLTQSKVHSNAENTDVCQILSFRGNLLNFRTLSFTIGCVNLICSITWAALIAWEGSRGKWYDMQSMPPSKSRVAVVVAAIGIALFLDCLQIALNMILHRFSWGIGPKLIRLLSFLIVLEIVCIVSGSAAEGALGTRTFGRWIYSVLQGLVWIKWLVGSYILGDYSPEFDREMNRWGFDLGDGRGMVYASAFLLNAFLAAVRGKWDNSAS